MGQTGKRKKLREYFPEDYEEEKETISELKLKEEEDKPPFFKGDDPRDSNFSIETEQDGNKIYVEDPKYIPESLRDEDFEIKPEFFIKELYDGNRVYLNKLTPGDSNIVRIKPKNGKHFTYEEQVEILIEFYRKYDPKKPKKK